MFHHSGGSSFNNSLLTATGREQAATHPFCSICHRGFSAGLLTSDRRTCKVCRRAVCEADSTFLPRDGLEHILREKEGPGKKKEKKHRKDTVRVCLECVTSIPPPPPPPSSSLSLDGTNQDDRSAMVAPPTAPAPFSAAPPVHESPLIAVPEEEAPSLVSGPSASSSSSCHKPSVARSMPWWSWLSLPFATISRSSSLLRRERTIGHVYCRVIEANGLVAFKRTGDDGREGDNGLLSSLADLLTGKSHEGGILRPYSNPFVEISVGQHVISTRTTRVINRTTEPRFDEAFVFAVQSPYAVLRCTVWHLVGGEETVPASAVPSAGSTTTTIPTTTTATTSANGNGNHDEPATTRVPRKEPLGEFIIPLSMLSDERAHEIWAYLRPCGAPPGERGILQILNATDGSGGNAGIYGGDVAAAGTGAGGSAAAAAVAGVASGAISSETAAAVGAGIATPAGPSGAAAGGSTTGGGGTATAAEIRSAHDSSLIIGTRAGKDVTLPPSLITTISAPVTTATPAISHQHEQQQQQAVLTATQQPVQHPQRTRTAPPLTVLVDGNAVTQVPPTSLTHSHHLETTERDPTAPGGGLLPSERLAIMDEARRASSTAEDDRMTDEGTIMGEEATIAAVRSLRGDATMVPSAVQQQPFAVTEATTIKKRRGPGFWKRMRAGVGAGSDSSRENATLTGQPVQPVIAGDPLLTMNRPSFLHRVGHRALKPFRHAAIKVATGASPAVTHLDREAAYHVNSAARDEQVLDVRAESRLHQQKEDIRRFGRDTNRDHQGDVAREVIDAEMPPVDPDDQSMHPRTRRRALGGEPDREDREYLLSRQPDLQATASSIAGQGDDHASQFIPASHGLAIDTSDDEGASYRYNEKADEVLDAYGNRRNKYELDLAARATRENAEREKKRHPLKHLLHPHRHHLDQAPSVAPQASGAAGSEVPPLGVGNVFSERFEAEQEQQEAPLGEQPVVSGLVAGKTVHFSEPATTIAPAAGGPISGDTATPHQGGRWRRRQQKKEERRVAEARALQEAELTKMRAQADAERNVGSIRTTEMLVPPSAAAAAVSATAPSPQPAHSLGIGPQMHQHQRHETTIIRDVGAGTGVASESKSTESTTTATTNRTAETVGPAPEYQPSILLAPAAMRVTTPPRPHEFTQSGRPVMQAQPAAQPTAPPYGLRPLVTPHQQQQQQAPSATHGFYHGFVPSGSVIKHTVMTEAVPRQQPPLGHQRRVSTVVGPPAPGAGHRQTPSTLSTLVNMPINAVKGVGGAINQLPGVSTVTSAVSDVLPPFKSIPVVSLIPSLLPSFITDIFEERKDAIEGEGGEGVVIEGQLPVSEVPGVTTTSTATPFAEQEPPPPIITSESVVHNFGLGTIHIQLQLRYDPQAEILSHFLTFESSGPQDKPAYSVPLLVSAQMRLWRAISRYLRGVTVWLSDGFTWRYLHDDRCLAHPEL
jgi:C2 domain